MTNLLWQWSKGWNSMKVLRWHQRTRIKDLLHFCKAIISPCSSKITSRGLKPEKDMSLWSWVVKWIALSWSLQVIKGLHHHKEIPLPHSCLPVLVCPSKLGSGGVTADCSFSQREKLSLRSVPRKGALHLTFSSGNTTDLWCCICTLTKTRGVFPDSKLPIPLTSIAKWSKHLSEPGVGFWMSK